MVRRRELYESNFLLSDPLSDLVGEGVGDPGSCPVGLYVGGGIDSTPMNANLSEDSHINPSDSAYF